MPSTGIGVTNKDIKRVAMLYKLGDLGRPYAFFGRKVAFRDCAQGVNVLVPV